MSRNTLTNETWSRLLPILKQLGIYRKKNLRKTVEGILFRLRTGCQWADIPSYFGKANSLYPSFRLIHSKQSKANIPYKKNREHLNVDTDWYLYKIRHLVENAFARLKHFRALATRYDKLKRNYESTVSLACALIWLKL